jgi:ferrous-iron efflux pump FieF
MTDIVVNAGVLAALGISKLTGWERADPAIAFVIAGYIMWNARHITGKVLDDLVNETATG